MTDRNKPRADFNALTATEAEIKAQLAALARQQANKEIATAEAAFLQSLKRKYRTA